MAARSTVTVKARIHGKSTVPFRGGARMPLLWWLAEIASCAWCACKSVLRFQVRVTSATCNAPVPRCMAYAWARPCTCICDRALDLRPRAQAEAARVMKGSCRAHPAARTKLQLKLKCCSAKSCPTLEKIQSGVSELAYHAELEAFDAFWSDDDVY